MGRPGRADFANARHHVMSRGARRQRIFIDDADRLAFLAELEDLADRHQTRVHAYALMPNHYHLLLETPRANLSRAMQKLNSSYCRHLNRRFEWDGPVFRARFTSRLVVDDNHWRYLLLYLHLNPVRAGIAADPDSARWTSHAAYLDPAGGPRWLTTSDLRKAYGTVDWYRSRLEQVRLELAEPPAGFDPNDLWGKASLVKPPEATPPHAIEPTVAVLEAARATGTEAAALFAPLPGKDQRPRWLAAWWLERRCGLTHREIARLLRGERSRVTRWIGTCQRRRWQDVTLTTWMVRLEEVAGATEDAGWHLAQPDTSPTSETSGVWGLS